MKPIYILIAISIVGVIILGALDKSTTVLVPITTTLIGIIVGKNSDSLLVAGKGIISKGMGIVMKK